MEKIVTIEAVGAYAEREYTRQDGTKDYIKSRGLMMKHGAEEFYGELTGYNATKYKETQFYENQLYAVRGYWSHHLGGENKDIHQNRLTITSIEPLIAYN
jgi:hypothetical protein